MVPDLLARSPESVNTAFPRITGYTLGDVREAYRAILQGSEISDDTKASIRAARDSGRSFQGVLLNDRRGGTP